MSELSSHDKAVLNAIFNPSLPLSDADQTETSDTLKDLEQDTPETNESKSLELKAVEQAESGDVAGALTTLNQAVTLTPNRPSLYNNRAQVYQLQGESERAFRDLTKAIELSGDMFKKTKCKALCQRGVLFRKNERPEEAKADFEGAARLGSKFAKSQLVEMNPYAAMCNQVLKRIMDETKQGV